MQAIRADYFGRSSFGMIMGLSSVVILLGQVGGPMVAGWAARWWRACFPTQPETTGWASPSWPFWQA
jgi:MFS family permease